jgi:flagellin FlaB
MGIKFRRLMYNNYASIGIGAIIIFIAMVLVAGIAASVIIQTSSTLELRAISTGQETKTEVSTGLAVISIEAYAASGSDISKLSIMIRPRAGSEEIDITHTFIELSNPDKKIILNYTTSFYSKPNGLSDIFSANVFPDDNYAYGDSNNTDGNRFGLLVIEDYDDSISSTIPIMNQGDRVYLCINTTGVVNGISGDTEILGQVVPEQGYPGLITFKTPHMYIEPVIELFWDM